MKKYIIAIYNTMTCILYIEQVKCLFDFFNKNGFFDTLTNKEIKIFKNKESNKNYKYIENFIWEKSGEGYYIKIQKIDYGE